ncbi:MAG TPA: serine/threonine-protein kinase [Thermoanaerobaculia bacterium]|nr:serine/threonine-protein kinase [Thermoanaerobaculia bacterium]
MPNTEMPAAIGHYEIERKLGRGAMGTVYAARDMRIGRRVALKTVQLHDGSFEDATAAKEFFLRLQREAEVSGALLHPNIVALYEAGYEGDRVHFLAMELVEGETLLELMKRHRPGPVPVDRALRIAADVLHGLSHAHAKGITHRDIKPANVLITADGVAKIADFGIARPETSSMTAAGALLGTPNYMSPEQVTGNDLSPRADLFSLGVVLYEMLAAVKPFVASDLTGILHNILRQEPAHVSDVNPSVPRPVGDLVARLMQKTPDARPTAAEALALFETPARTAPPHSPPVLRRRIPAVQAASVVAIAIALVVIPVMLLRARIDATPSATIPASQLIEFENKRRALEAADALFMAGKYEESLLSYEAYLDRYPHSLAAEEGRDRAAMAIADAEKAAAAPAETARTAAKKKKDEDISARELLNRIKRVFKP